MRRPRIKIAGLLGLVALAAIGAFGLRNIPEGWPGPALCLGVCGNAPAAALRPLIALAVALNLAATVAPLATGGRTRAVAVGYAIGGWSYLGSSLVTPSFGGVFGDLTAKYWPLINRAHQYYPLSESLEFGRYRMVAHCLLTIATGSIGALIALEPVRRPRALARYTPSTGNP